MMLDKVTYEYAIIRVVPVVEREEFMNVGVILFSKRRKFLEMRYHIDSKRLNSFSDKLDLASINAYLKAWQDVCEGGPKGGAIGEMDVPSRFRWLTASRSTIIQSSPIHPGLCEDPKKVLEKLFERNVL